jgi:ribonuclease HI
MGIGWVINGESHSEYIDKAPGNTNNVAEYLAITRILEHAMDHPEITDLFIIGDSQLVTYQLSGAYAVRSPSLQVPYMHAKRYLSILAGRGCRVQVNWVPREQNTQADIASKAALAAHGISAAERKPTTKHVGRYKVAGANG